MSGAEIKSLCGVGSSQGKQSSGKGGERKPWRFLKIVLASVSASSVWLEVPPSAGFSFFNFFSVTKLTLDDVPWL